MYLSHSWRWLRNLVPGAKNNHRIVTAKRPRGRELFLEVLEDRVVPTAPTFTPLTHTPPDSIGEMMLLPNGTVMAQGGGITNAWYSLKADSHGNFVDGTWTSLTSMNVQRLYFGSAVLPTGNVFVIGGEYGSLGVEQFLNTAESYNPTTNLWTAKASFPKSQFGDDPVEVLPNGKLLLGYLAGAQTYIYDPTANTYTATGTKLLGDASDEEAWVKLADGSILSYDIFASISTGVFHAQRYIPATGTWVDASATTGGVLTGTTLSTPKLGYELGPAFLLPNGKVLQLGASNHTAIYDPTVNSWSAGPDIPGNFGCDDAPGAVLADGQVVFEGDSGLTKLFGSPSALFDYDPTSNSITNITNTLPANLQTSLNGDSAYTSRMVELPNGQVLYGDGGSSLYVITPAGAPKAAWAPTVTSVTGTGPYTLTGTQINGLDEGAGYGDDVMMASNYPIIELTSSTGTVSFATSFNWTSLVATGNTPETTEFNLPAGIADGSYTLTVSANGISSAGLGVTITGGILTVNAATTVSSVTSTTATGTYGTGANINVTVNFGGAVNVTGTPTLALNDGGTATYTGGGGTSALTFTYTVAAGQSTGHLDYASTSALSGTIKDTGGNNANLTLPAPGAAGSLGANSTIAIDAVAPTVLNISSSTVDGSYSNPAVITIKILFSKAVNVVSGTPTLALSSGGTAAYTTGTGTNTLTFTYNVGAGDSTHGVNLDAASTSALLGNIKDTVGNNPNPANLTVAVGSGTAGALAKNDNLIIVPITIGVTGVTSTTPNSTYGAGANINVTVTFGGVVTVTGTPTLALSDGGTATFTGGSGTSALTFSYIVLPGQASAHLDYASTTALSGGTIKDVNSNNASVTLASPGAAGSLSANSFIVIDAVAPTVTGVSSTTATGLYGIGATISVTLTWSKAVNVTGTPALALNSGGTASFTGGNGTATLTFSYTVAAGQNSARLDYTGTGALALNGGTIKDTVLNNPNSAVLTLPAPQGGADALYAKNIGIDGTVPVVTNVTSTTPNGSYTVGATIFVTVTFNEVMTVTGFPQLALNSGGTAAYFSGGGSNTLTFKYTVAGGQNSAHLDYTATGALALNGGTIKDAASNTAVLTLAAPGTAGSLGANTSIVINTTPPTVLHYYVLFGTQKYDLLGSTRLDLPWQITGIQVVFSEAIATGSIASLTGIASTGFTGLGTNTLTWSFNALGNGSFITALVTSGLKDAAGNALLAPNTAENFKVLIDDVTGDGYVNQADLIALVQVFGQADNSHSIFADVLGAGSVNLADFNAVQKKTQGH